MTGRKPVVAGAPNPRDARLVGMLGVPTANLLVLRVGSVGISLGSKPQHGVRVGEEMKQRGQEQIRQCPTKGRGIEELSRLLEEVDLIVGDSVDVGASDQPADVSRLERLQIDRDLLGLNGDLNIAG